MDYKKKISNLIKAQVNIEIEDIENLIEAPPKPEIGDYTLPCFHLANALRKSPNIIAEELRANIKCDEFEKVVNLGPYLNFFVNKSVFIRNTLEEILNKGEDYGNSKVGEGRIICIDYSLSYIDKDVDIKQLFTTIIGNSLYNLFKKEGYNVKRLNKVGNFSVKFDELSSEGKRYTREEKFYSNKCYELGEELRKKDLLIESNGVEVVMLEEYNMPPYIFLNEDKEAIYATRELVTIIDRKKRYDFYKYIYIDILPKTLYFKKMFKVLELAEYDWESNCIHAGIGLVKFEDRELLATKTKDIIRDNLINESVGKVLEVINENNPNIKSKEELAKNIVINAIVFTYLKNSRKKEVIFDLKDILSFESEGGLYVTYSYETVKSILRRSGKSDGVADFSKLNSKEEINLVNFLGKFKSVIHLAIDELEPFIVAKYIIDVTKTFNEFYKTYPILSLDDKSLMKARLLLVESTYQVLKNALGIIGIN